MTALNTMEGAGFRDVYCLRAATFLFILLSPQKMRGLPWAAAQDGGPSPPAHLLQSLLGVLLEGRHQLAGRGRVRKAGIPSARGFVGHLLGTNWKHTERRALLI